MCGHIVATIPPIMSAHINGFLCNAGDSNYISSHTYLSSCYIDIKEEETVRFSKLIFGDISADKFSLVTNYGSA
jgi:hypothetical protein